MKNMGRESPVSAERAVKPVIRRSRAIVYRMVVTPTFGERSEIVHIPRFSAEVGHMPT
jgi:hypothetical protein